MTLNQNREQRLERFTFIIIFFLVPVIWYVQLLSPVHCYRCGEADSFLFFYAHCQSHHTKKTIKNDDNTQRSLFTVQRFYLCNFQAFVHSCFSSFFLSSSSMFMFKKKWKWHRLRVFCFYFSVSLCGVLCVRMHSSIFTWNWGKKICQSFYASFVCYFNFFFSCCWSETGAHSINSIL